MIVVLESLPIQESPRDLRRASIRSRDAWLASGDDFRVVEPGDPEAVRAEASLIVRQPEAAVARGALSAATRLLARTPEISSVIPSGFFPGSARSSLPYSTLWELDEIASCEPALLEESWAGPPAPVELVRTGNSAGASVSAGGFVIHSFAGRNEHTRSDVAALVERSARHVLEIGCATGALGSELQRGGARVTGIESNVVSALVAARRLHRVIALPLERAWDELTDRFDTVVAADLLEHLEDPVRALSELENRTTPDARLVFSLPNASNAAVLAGCLRGRWDPALEGIVADDHKTYAGRRGWARLLAAGGWEVERWIGTPHLGPSLEPWIPILRSEELSEEDLRAVQWLGVARKRQPGPRLELGESVDPNDSGILDPDDPLSSLRRAFEREKETQLRISLANATEGEIVARLLSGEIVTGRGRVALVRAATLPGLTSRLEGAGFTFEVRPGPEVPLPSRVSSVVALARNEGLVAEPDLLSPSCWLLQVGGGR